MAITVCTHPQRCAGMEQAHSDMAAQLCAAWVEVARLKAQLAVRDETITALRADNDTLRGDVAFHLDGFKQQCSRQEAR